MSCSVVITGFSLIAILECFSWLVPTTKEEQPEASELVKASQWMEINKSAFSELAKAVLSYNSGNISLSRV